MASEPAAEEPAAEEPAAELRQYYDTYYDVYWRPFERPDQRAPRKVEMLLRQHVYPGARCLDVGCGDGRAGTVVTGCGGAYIGVDISQRAVAAARGRALDARLIKGADHLPFADNSFDVVLCLEVIEHVFLPDRSIQEILRVLSPGGTLIVTTPNVAYWRRRLDLALLGRWNPFGYGLALYRRAAVGRSTHPFLQRRGPAPASHLVRIPVDSSGRAFGEPAR